MNTRIIRRSLAAAALGATAALAMPGTAFAVSAPIIQTQIGVNTVSFTLTVPITGVSEICAGPWIHTEADATAILNSPTLDVANKPLNWFVGSPVSPTGAGGSPYINPDGSTNYVNAYSGQTVVAKLPYIADGRYVAGIACYQAGGNDYVLTQIPFTIGNPDTSEPGGTGSLGSLSFGS
ncbi:hypothetical protein LCL87_17045 [Rhodococcus hoagii]|nr:hypothetical protein [Prescottella equi]